MRRVRPFAIAGAAMLTLGAGPRAVPSPDDRSFPADAVVDVTKAPYNAKPNDRTDDTAAIQKAITDNVGTGRSIYFPAGVYDISDTLVAKNAKGQWEAHLTLQGQGQTLTTLRLSNNCGGFDDPAKPKAMLMTGNHQEPGDDPAGGGNKAFRNNIFDLTVDAGFENPGAIGIEWAVSNQGAIQNVNVLSLNGDGVAGISMRRRIPGPGLIDHVYVTGFDVGIDVGDMQYGVTLDQITLAKQRVAGIRTDRNLIHVAHLNSDNVVPSISVTTPLGFATVVDSLLRKGEKQKAPGPAIDCNGTLFLRGVTTSGYGAEPAMRVHAQPVAGEKFEQYTSSPAIGGGAKGAPITAPARLIDPGNIPAYWNAHPADWVAVGPRQPGEKDDTQAIQRAIDAGKSTVYFPNNRAYFLSDTVVIQGSVRQVLGMGSEISLGAAKEPFSDKAHPRPLMRIDPVAGQSVSLDNLFFNAQYSGEVIFENNSPKPLSIRHCAGWIGAEGFRRSYQNTPRATGPVYIEDCFLPGWAFDHQKVVARQFNPENPDGDGATPQVSNIGGELWILGFKTEGPAPFIVTRAGGKTEVLGGYNYISATAAPKVPADAIPYLAEDSLMSLTFLSDNFRADSDYATYIRDAHRDGKSISLRAADLLPRNGNPGDRSLVVPLYAPAPATSSKKIDIAN